MKKICLLFALLGFIVYAFAAPARRVPSTHRQSDGTTIYIVVNGDETFHYYTTIDGIPVVKGDNGDYCYATFSLEEGFLSTGCTAHNTGERSFEELQIIDVNKFYGIDEMLATRALAARRSAPSRAATVAPKGVVNVPVLLVEFSDVKFTFTKEEVGDFLNKENYEGYENPIVKSIGSAKDYFIAQSGGQFIPNFIVTDVVTLPNNMEYYGGNNASGSDRRPGHMIADGLSAADDNFDFSIFDNNGDGEVEFVYCIYAGYGENVTGNDENSIWPHQWDLSSTTGTKSFDGVKFNVYACSNELAISEEFSEAYGGKYLSGIGTMCHEFSHCLGLPDLYDTSNNGTGLSTFGYWDIMDSGSYTAEGYIPTGYSAYERDFMGWRKIEELNKKGEYSMTALTSGGSAYKIVNDANSNEYYILECRKQEGWDQYLFNSGMLISHVDYDQSAWDRNVVNTTKSHLRLSLIPADNEILEFDGSNGAEANASYRADVWPGTTGNTAFTDTSLPAAELFTGGFLGKPVTNINYADGVVSFLFMAIVDTPVVLPATEITDSCFTANWEAVEDATEYTVELEKVVQLAEGEGDAIVLLSENFMACEKANEAILVIDDYTSVSGWTGTKLYGEVGVIRVGTSSSAGTLKTPKLNYNGTVNISFSLAKYNPSDTEPVLTVSLVNENGVAVSSVDFSANEDWEEKELAFDVTGDFYIEFNTIKCANKKRVKIDNIVVSYNSSYSTVAVDKVTTTETSCIFTGLESGAVYQYRVSASAPYGSSDFSAYESVVMPSTTSIDSVIVDNNAICEIYTLNGILLYSGSKDNLPVLPLGVYIIKSGNNVKKINL